MLSYAELADEIERATRRLEQHGVGEGHVVALSLERSPAFVALALATMRVGAAYLPLSPAAPEPHREAIIAASRPALAFTSGAEQVLVADVEVQALDSPRRLTSELLPAAACAYVIYTSGSTGEPKGVMVGADGLRDFVDSATRVFGYTADDTLLQFASLSWDTHVEEIYPALQAGATLALRTADSLSSLAALMEYCDRWRVSVVNLPTALWVRLVEEEVPVPPWIRTVIVGGEAVPQTTVARWLERHPSEPTLLNTYGCTEATAVTLVADLTALGATGGHWAPLGRPLPHVRVDVEREGDDEVGELVIAGSSVGLGYLGDERLTRDRFATSAGARAYRTGDRVRWGDGGVEFVGRRDDQVKVRGHRVELGDVEARAQALDGVAQACVVAVADGHSQRLVAHVVGTGPLTEETVRERLRAVLPGYMVPAEIRLAGSLPLTSSGKVDRQRLSAESSEPAVRVTATDTPAMAFVALCEEVVGHGLDPGRSFVEQGGDSISALVVVSRMAGRGEDGVGTGELLSAASLGELAAEIRPGPAPEPPPSAAAEARLTPSQLGVLVDVSRSDDPRVYVTQELWELHGELDLPALERAWQAVAAAYPALRQGVRFEAAGEPALRHADPAALAVEDLRALGGAEAERRLAAILDEDLERGFVLEQPPLARLTLVRRDERRATLIWTSHELALDGWSNSLVLAALFGLLADPYAEPPASPPPSAYFDWLDGSGAAPAAAYWRAIAAGLPPVTPAPGAHAGRAGARRLLSVERRLSADSWTKFQGVLRDHGLTLSDACRAAWSLVLAAHSGRPEVSFGVVASGRPAGVRGADRLVGCFVNTVPFAARVDAMDGLTALLRSIHDRSTALAPFDSTPLARIREWAGARPGEDLFRSVLLVQTFPGAGVESVELPRLTARKLRDVQATPFPLTVAATPRAAGLEVCLEADSGHWHERDLEQLADHVVAVLAQIAGTGGSGTVGAAMFPDAAATPALAGARRRLGHKDAAALFRQAYEDHGDRVALEAGSRSVTYAELGQMTERVGGALARRVAPGATVGFLGTRSIEAIVCLLSSLEARTMFCFLDAEAPPARTAQLARDAGLELLVSAASGDRRFGHDVVALAELPAGDGARRPGSPRDAAYVCFTSGTTGRPRGVVVSHAALANYTQGAAERYAVAPGDRVLQFSSLAFDFSIAEIAPTLAAGGTLVLRDDRYLASPESFWRAAADDRIATMQLPASFFAVVAEAVLSGSAEPPRSLRTISIGGEKPDPASVDRWLAAHPEVRLFNGYGPTEATVEVLVRRCDPEAGIWGIAAGDPLPNLAVSLRDPWFGTLRAVPIGAPGELCIEGAQLADGYVNDATAEHERFLAPSRTGLGARLYRTGDLARMRPDGDLTILGRTDDQLSIRGYRVEPAEVEAALRDVAGVEESAVCLIAEDGLERLVAAIRGDAAAPAAARAALEVRLPSFMRPSAYLHVDQVPRTASGKIDRPAVAALVRPALAEAGPSEAGTSAGPAEAVALRVWEEALGRPVALDDDVFALGVTSLDILKVASRLSEVVGADVDLPTLFEFPDARTLARHLAEISDSEALTSAPRA